MRGCPRRRCTRRCRRGSGSTAGGVSAKAPLAGWGARWGGAERAYGDGIGEPGVFAADAAGGVEGEGGDWACAVFDDGVEQVVQCAAAAAAVFDGAGGGGA